MRSIRLALLLAFAITPALASAAAWKGITPGTTLQAEVVEKLGEPTSKTQRAGRTALVYTGEQAPEGTRRAQIYVDGQGVVVEITIFLTVQLDAETIEGRYGKPPKRTFVEDTFQKVWLYPTAGVTVYFNKDGNVEALMFGPAAKGQAKGGAAEGAGPAQPTAAPAQPAATR
jgi:hypothetical protein